MGRFPVRHRLCCGLQELVLGRMTPRAAIIALHEQCTDLYDGEFRLPFVIFLDREKTFRDSPLAKFLKDHKLGIVELVVLLGLEGKAGLRVWLWMVDRRRLQRFVKSLDRENAGAIGGA